MRCIKNDELIVHIIKGIEKKKTMNNLEKNVKVYTY